MQPKMKLKGSKKNNEKLFSKNTNYFIIINSSPKDLWIISNKSTRSIYDLDCWIGLLILNFFLFFYWGEGGGGTTCNPSTFDGNNYSLAESQGGKIFYAANNTYFCGYWEREYYWKRNSKNKDIS